MKQDLLAKLAPRLKGLEEGGYVRGYVKGGKSRPTGTHELIVNLLDAMKIPYRESVRTGVGSLMADFKVNETLMFVDREFTQAERKQLAGRKLDCVIVNRDLFRSDRFDHGIRVVGIGEEAGIQTIFLDDPAFNFDYAHILPKTQKCSVMHGHTSSALVEVIGHPLEGMVVDFAIAKRVVKNAIQSLDHKLLINEKYVTKMDEKSVTLMFETVHGPFAIRAPKATTILLKGEATVENLAKEILSRIAVEMPQNVTAVGVYVYEGLNKGSHLLAKIHQDGARKRKRKQ